jgi:hypothetical protein
MGIPSYSGLLAVLGNPILVEFLAASTILGLLWGFMEAFLFIHLGSYTLVDCFGFRSHPPFSFFFRHSPSVSSLYLSMACTSVI